MLSDTSVPIRRISPDPWIWMLRSIIEAHVQPEREHPYLPPRTSVPAPGGALGARALPSPPAPLPRCGRGKQRPAVGCSDAARVALSHMFCLLSNLWERGRSPTSVCSACAPGSALEAHAAGAHMSPLGAHWERAPLARKCCPWERGRFRMKERRDSLQSMILSLEQANTRHVAGNRPGP